jgi:hypothetical protein
MLFAFRVEVVFADLGVWGNLTGNNTPPTILSTIAAAMAATTIPLFRLQISRRKLTNGRCLS